MHNEYITSCCILNKKKKLLLLKYADIDITQTSMLLYPITLELMNQCYNHLEKFHNLNKQRSKKYSKLEPLITEQLKDMMFIRKKFTEYFSKLGEKTKADLFTYIYAFQISNYYFSHYIYSVLLGSVKKDFTLDFWQKYDLEIYELATLGLSDFYILNDTKNESSTGQINLDLKPAIGIIEKHIELNYKTIGKLDIAKKMSCVIDNFCNIEYPGFNNPYKDNILELIDNIKVSTDLEKPKQLIKCL